MAIPFRFIHCSDLHLGAPFKYLKSPGRQGDEAILQATYRSFEQIARLTVEERVDALLISGDVYNSEDHNLEAQARFVRELEKITSEGIPVFIVQGNHDPAESWQADIAMPEGVHIFSAAEVERVPLVVRGQEVAAVYGMSCSKGRSTENLALRYKRSIADGYAIGMLHGTVGGSEEHDMTAPCSLSDLEQSGMDYWALGHIHKREVLREAPLIVYPGNSQGLHRKELGSKGCCLVQVSANGHAEVTFHETCAIRFEDARIDITGLQSVSDIEEMIRHKKEMLRTKYKKPVLLTITFAGQGILSRLCSEGEVRDMWLKTAQEEEKGKYGFVLPCLLIDETRPELDLQARRQLPDMTGDYLAAYDRIASLSPEERRVKVRECLEARPETKRLGRYETLFTDQMLDRALQRAELEGALRLAGDTDED